MKAHWRMATRSLTLALSEDGSWFFSKEFPMGNTQSILHRDHMGSSLMDGLGISWELCTTKGLKVGHMQIYIYIYYGIRCEVVPCKNTQYSFRAVQKGRKTSRPICSLFYWLNYNISLTIWLLLKIVPRVLFPSFSPVTKQTASKHWSSLRWATSDVSWYVKPSSYRYLPLPTM